MCGHGGESEFLFGQMVRILKYHKEAWREIVYVMIVYLHTGGLFYYGSQTAIS